MLYNADATVRVLTEPAFLEVTATIIAWAYGWYFVSGENCIDTPQQLLLTIAYSRTERIHATQGDRSAGNTSSAIKSGSAQI